MGKMQSVNFASVDEFLDFLPDSERAIVDVLRELILESIPNCQEKLSYNVPFYYRHYRMCFIWPPAVLWGSKPIPSVEIGFCYGNLLNDEANYLERGKRKQIYMKTYQNVNEIDVDMIRSYLFDAVQVDDELHLQKK